MNPENLRIGNFVIPKQGNFILNKMEFINRDYPKLTRQGMIDLINNHIEVMEVPLTEHWLEKLGFTKTYQDDTFKTYSLRGFEISFSVNDITSMEIKFGAKFIINHEGINSVHKLQNLYHSILAKDL